MKKDVRVRNAVIRTVLITVLLGCAVAFLVDSRVRRAEKRSVAKWEVRSGGQTFYSVALPLITEQGCVSIMNLDGKAQILCGNVQIGQR